MTSSSAAFRAEVIGFAARLEPETMTGDQAASVVRDLAIAEKACATARMFAALRVARTDAWRGQGHQSAADWLAAQAGISVSAASAQLGTAKKAERLPKTKEAMAKGDLSPDQAGAVTDAATADPDAEDELLESAERDTNAELKKKAAAKKAAATDSASRERRIHRERTLRTRVDADGAFSLYLRGPAQLGVRFLAQLKPHIEGTFRDARANGERDTYDNRCHDAFYALLDELNARAARGASTDRAPSRSESSAEPDGGEPVGHQDPTTTPPGKRSPGGNNTKVIVRIDHEALLRGRTEAGETCEVEGVGPISVAAAKKLMRDAFLAAVITKGRDVVNVAHLGRGLSAHQRTAIEAMGLRCSNRACNRTVAIQIDHRVPWASEPITELDNADPYCPHCHDLKTHHGWKLEPGTGPRRFLPPDQSGTGPPDPVHRPHRDDDPFPDAPGRGHVTGRQRIEQPSLC